MRAEAMTLRRELAQVGAAVNVPIAPVAPAMAGLGSAYLSRGGQVCMERGSLSAVWVCALACAPPVLTSQAGGLALLKQRTNLDECMHGAAAPVHASRHGVHKWLAPQDVTGDPGVWHITQLGLHARRTCS